MKPHILDIINNWINIYSYLKREKYNSIENVSMFTQTWGSTALGFPGIGGSALTTAYTYVLEIKNAVNNIYYVFFDGEFAYSVTNPTQQFFDDLKNHKMADCFAASKIY